MLSRAVSDRGGLDGAEEQAPLPVVDIGPLFAPASADRRKVDLAVLRAAEHEGFLLVEGLPADIPMGPAIRGELLRFFQMPEPLKRGLSRNLDDPARAPSLRGWFRRRERDATYHEGLDIGPDIGHGRCVLDEADPLRRATPLLPEEALPGGRAAARRYYLGMERLCDALIRALARALGAAEEELARPFANGLSTLRLLRYPLRGADAAERLADEELHVTHAGERRVLAGEAHTDFGFITVLAQDEVGGLQARLRDGGFVDVPSREGTLAINFGRLLERWTGGRIKATEHRVLSSGRERFSIPFFYEPRADARIAPLPLAGAEPFEPFLYGDHAWEAQPRLRRVFGEQRIKTWGAPALA